MELSDDPLELKQLAVNYDYLMFKISDHITNLCEQTHQAVQSKQKLVDGYFKDQLHMEDELNKIEQMIEKCNEVELSFLKLDQLALFVEDFKHRLAIIENDINTSN